MKKVICFVLCLIIIFGIIFFLHKDFNPETTNDVPEFVGNSEYNYSKTIGDVNIKLIIPDGWNYEECTDIQDENIKFSLMFYKTSKDEYASLNFYTNKFAVCGTGLAEQTIVLNNGIEAIVGYYDESEIWDFISFYTYNTSIAFTNNGLNSDESKEVLEFAKTLSVNSRKTENVSIEVVKDTITPEGISIVITDNNENQYGWGVEFKN